MIDLLCTKGGSMLIKTIAIVLLCFLFWILLAISRVQMEGDEKTGKKLSNSEFNKAVIRKLFSPFRIKKHPPKKRRAR